MGFIDFSGDETISMSWFNGPAKSILAVCPSLSELEYISFCSYLFSLLPCLYLRIFEGFIGTYIFFLTIPWVKKELLFVNISNSFFTSYYQTISRESNSFTFGFVVLSKVYIALLHLFLFTNCFWNIPPSNSLKCTTKG